MALTREQHNQIMRVYQERQLRHAAEREQHLEEVRLHVPEFVRIEDELSALRMAHAVQLLKKEKHEAAAGNGTLSFESGAGRTKENDGKPAGGTNEEGAFGLPAKIKKLEQRKRELLSEHGYPADYLAHKYDCPDCRDTGYAGGQKCGCHKKLISELIYREAGLPASLTKENFATFRMDIFDDRELIPQLLEQNGLRMTQRIYMQKVNAQAKRFTEAFREKHGNLLLMGSAGTGKTFLSNCIAKELIEQCRPVIYVSAGTFFDRLEREKFGRLGEEETGLSEKSVSDCELLIIDDLGTELTTSFTLSKLFSIINNRLQPNKSTIISTNLTLNDLSRVYGDRVVSRIMQSFTVIPFYGKDLRLRGGS